MITIIEEHSARRHARLLDEMFRLRARVFASRLGWDVCVRHGQERDRFDDQGPIYVVHTDDEGRVNASCRLLPTTGPTLLAETFSDTLPDAAGISSPSVWECTRLCVEDDAGRSPGEMLRTAGEVIAAAGAVALRSGVDSYLANFDAARLRIFRRLGCEIEILGSTNRFGQTVFLGALRVAPDVIATIRRRIAPPAPWTAAAAA